MVHPINHPILETQTRRPMSLPVTLPKVPGIFVLSYARDPLRTFPLLLEPELGHPVFDVGTVKFVPTHTDPAKDILCGHRRGGGRASVGNARRRSAFFRSRSE